MAEPLFPSNITPEQFYTAIYGPDIILPESLKDKKEDTKMKSECWAVYYQFKGEDSGEMHIDRHETEYGAEIFCRQFKDSIEVFDVRREYVQRDEYGLLPCK